MTLRHITKLRREFMLEHERDPEVLHLRRDDGLDLASSPPFSARKEVTVGGPYKITRVLAMHVIHDAKRTFVE